MADKLANDTRHSFEAGPEEQVVQNELQRKLTALINKLDEQQREIMLLRIYGELSFKEIGELAGISENNARVIYHRVKLHLHKEMGEGL